MQGSSIALNKFLNDRSNKQLLSIVLLGYSIFLIVIFTIFIPTANQMDKTGYSIDDFQLAQTPENMSNILEAWENILDVVILQLWGDYFFILGGLIGNLAIFLFFIKNLENQYKIVGILGLIFTFFSRSADIIENFFSLLIVYNPTSYPPFLVSLTSFFATIKFLFVAIVYFLMSICIILVIYNLIKRKFRNMD